MVDSAETMPTFSGISIFNKDSAETLLTFSGISFIFIDSAETLSIGKHASNFWKKQRD